VTSGRPRKRSHGNGSTRTVARYTRVTVVAEQVDAPPPALTESRMLEDRLGLSPMSMLRLQWEIVADEVAERRTSKDDDDNVLSIRAV
jgi:hypothetical protein